MKNIMICLMLGLSLSACDEMANNTSDYNITVPLPSPSPFNSIEEEKSALNKIAQKEESDEYADQNMEQQIHSWYMAIFQERKTCDSGDKEACEDIAGFEQSLKEEGRPIPPPSVNEDNYEEWYLKKQ